MKLTRSSKISLKFTTKSKKEKLKHVMSEYSNVVNFFIDHFWQTEAPQKAKLLKPIVDLPETWLSARLRKVAAREAIDLILSVKNKKNPKARNFKPKHKGKSMSVSCTIADLQTADTHDFNAWLHLSSIGNKIILDLPIKFHKHYNKLTKQGKRLNSYIIKENSVQLCFEIETDAKKTDGKILGIDTGINALATTDEGNQYGKDIKQLIETIKRCKHGSNRQKQLRRALRQRMDEVAKEVTQDAKLVVIEGLKKMNHKTKVKRRLTKNMRRSLGAWNYRYWLNRLQWTCENNRVAYRTVAPAYTSQRCYACEHTERGNRNGEMFKCLKCGHEDKADINAAKNILLRFTTGPYGAGYKPKNKFLGTVLS